MLVHQTVSDDQRAVIAVKYSTILKFAPELSQITRHAAQL